MNRNLCPREEEHKSLVSRLEEFNLKQVFTYIVKNFRELNKNVYIAKYRYEHKYIYVQINIEDCQERIYPQIESKIVNSDAQLGMATMSSRRSANPEDPIVVLLQRGKGRALDVINLTPNSLAILQRNMATWNSVPSQQQNASITAPALTVNNINLTPVDFSPSYKSYNEKPDLSSSSSYNISPYVNNVNITPPANLERNDEKLEKTG